MKGRQMKTNHERKSESGNALIYVLIAIALFAALTFVLSRQADNGDTGGISEDKASLYATQLISYATQAKQSIDQMLFSGADIDDLDFTPPDDAGFNAGDPGDRIYMVYHPDGGGLIPGKIPSEAIQEEDSDPEPGWYLGKFSNVDWTATANDDVILVAYQIRPEVCQKINDKMGIGTIPSITSAIKLVMIDEDSYGTGSNTDLTTDSGEICPECHDRGSLCVQEGGIYAFYTLVADQ